MINPKAKPKRRWIIPTWICLLSISSGAVVMIIGNMGTDFLAVALFSLGAVMLAFGILGLVWEVIPPEQETKQENSMDCKCFKCGQKLETYEYLYCHECLVNELKDVEAEIQSLTGQRNDQEKLIRGEIPE